MKSEQRTADMFSIKSFWFTVRKFTNFTMNVNNLDRHLFFIVAQLNELKSVGKKRNNPFYRFLKGRVHTLLRLMLPSLIFSIVIWLKKRRNIDYISGDIRIHVYVFTRA